MVGMTENVEVCEVGPRSFMVYRQSHAPASKKPSLS